MKKITTAILVITFFATINTQAQGLKDLINNTTGKKGGLGNLSGDEIGRGLKEALSIGVKKGAEKLANVDGFLGNAAVKILLPPEAQQVEQKLRGLGFNKQVDEAITSMNRAAEDAAKSAAPIFVNAIKSMSITDAVGLLKSNDSAAATSYLKSKTTNALTAAFSPVIDASLTKTEATKYWTALFGQYNKIPFVKKINPDLKAYVTDRALSGMFYQVAQEEAKIRKNPAAQTTDLLKKVFGGK